MVHGCGPTFAKYTLFFFNTLFFLGGAAILGIGIWLRVDTNSFTNILTKVNPTGDESDLAGNIVSQNVNTIHIIAYVLIAIGGFVFLVGFMGCCGACKQWRALLVMYAICLIIIMLAEIGIGIAVGVYKSQVKEIVRTELRKVVDRYDYVPTFVTRDILRPNSSASWDPNTVKETATLNTLQAWVGCCGIDNYATDYANTSYGRKMRSDFGAMIPPAFCCKFTKPVLLKLADPTCNHPENRTDPTISNYQTGCVQKIDNFMNQNAPAVIGVTVGIGLMELIGVFLAFCLCCAISDKYD